MKCFHLLYWVMRAYAKQPLSEADFADAPDWAWPAYQEKLREYGKEVKPLGS